MSERPVLALGALELAVEGAGARLTNNRCGGGTGLTVQAQVDRGPNATLL